MTVIDDSNAYVGMDACEVSNNSTERHVTAVQIQVRNQYTETFGIAAVENRVDTQSLPLEKTTNIEPGHAITFSVSLAASDPRTVRVHVSSDSFFAAVSGEIHERSAC
jgi:hypothetical protein